MMKMDKQALLMLLISVLASCRPAEAWYKQAAGPTYYSVGRAAGLLSGIRRSPFRRAELDTRESGESSEHEPPSDTHLPHGAVCVKSMTPNLQSCELVQEPRATFRCEATVFITLGSRECV